MYYWFQGKPLINFQWTCWNHSNLFINLWRTTLLPPVILVLLLCFVMHIFSTRTSVLQHYSCWKSQFKEHWDEWKATHAYPPTSPKIEKKRVTGYSCLSYFSSLSSFLSSSTLPLLLPFCVLLSTHYTLIIFLCFDVWAFWNPQAVGLGMGYLIRLLCNIWWVKCWGNHVKRPDGALCIASKKGQFAAVTSVPSLNPICSNIRLCVKGVKTTKG